MYADNIILVNPSINETKKLMYVHVWTWITVVVYVN